MMVLHLLLFGVVILITISFLTLFFVISMTIANLFGAPYVPSSARRLKTMLKLAKVKKGMKVADLGSGDGKVVIEFAKLGAKVDGFEINPFLVFRSRMKIKRLGLENASIYLKSFWNQDLSKYDLIIVYGIGVIMGRLEKKLKKELKPGTKVISNYFSFPNWKPQFKKRDILVYVKKKP